MDDTNSLPSFSDLWKLYDMVLLGCEGLSSDAAHGMEALDFGVASMDLCSNDDNAGGVNWPMIHHHVDGNQAVGYCLVILSKHLWYQDTELGFSC